MSGFERGGRLRRWRTAAAGAVSVHIGGLVTSGLFVEVNSQQIVIEDLQDGEIGSDQASSTNEQIQFVSDGVVWDTGTDHLQIGAEHFQKCWPCFVIMQVETVSEGVTDSKDSLAGFIDQQAVDVSKALAICDEPVRLVAVWCSDLVQTGPQVAVDLIFTEHFLRSAYSSILWKNRC